MDIAEQIIPFFLQLLSSSIIFVKVKGRKSMKTDVQTLSAHNFWLKTVSLEGF